MTEETQVAVTEAAAAAAEEISGDGGIEIPETFYSPLGISVNKVDTPNGRLTLLKFLAPGHIHSFKLTDDQIGPLVERLTGGVQIAKPSDLARLKS